MKNLSKQELREAIITAHGMATAKYIQNDMIMRNRIGNVLEKAIRNDSIMSGFLGRQDGDSSRDILKGNTDLED